MKFNEDERVSYLTGFQKRKKERRIRGYAHQMVKERKEKLRKRKERRATVLNGFVGKRKFENQSSETVDGEGGDVGEGGKEEEGVKEVVKFGDDEVVRKFGGEVTVTVSTTLPQDKDESSGEEEEEEEKEDGRGRRDGERRVRREDGEDENDMFTRFKMKVRRDIQKLERKHSKKKKRGSSSSGGKSKKGGGGGRKSNKKKKKGRR